MTTFYELPRYTTTMKTQTNQTQTKSVWDKTVHATFRKVMAFDMLFMALGITAGTGLGAYLVTAGLVQ